MISSCVLQAVDYQRSGELGFSEYVETRRWGLEVRGGGISRSPISSQCLFKLVFRVL